MTDTRFVRAHEIKGWWRHPSAVATFRWPPTMSEPESPSGGLQPGLRSMIGHETRYEPSMGPPSIFISVAAALVYLTVSFMQPDPTGNQRKASCGEAHDESLGWSAGCFGFSPEGISSSEREATDDEQPLTGACPRRVCLHCSCTDEPGEYSFIWYQGELQ